MYTFLSVGNEKQKKMYYGCINVVKDTVRIATHLQLTQIMSVKLNNNHPNMTGISCAFYPLDFFLRRQREVGRSLVPIKLA